MCTFIPHSIMFMFIKSNVNTTIFIFIIIQSFTFLSRTQLEIKSNCNLFHYNQNHNLHPHHYPVRNYIHLLRNQEWTDGINKTKTTNLDNIISNEHRFPTSYCKMFHPHRSRSNLPLATGINDYNINIIK